jgi:6-phosphogluconolactonase/glucosamine-6-phosphate isomerase/deaminase
VKSDGGKPVIRWKKIKTTQPAIDYLFETIDTRLLAGQRVFWLVAGGSTMSIAVEVARKLSKRGSLSRLSVSLTDERYGEVGHSDSNWQQLIDGGFSLPDAKLYPVLGASNLEEKVEQYTGLLETEIAASDFAVASAGLGADGHIFGIKPKSPALNSSRSAVGYVWEDFVRITPTIKFIKQLDEVVVYAVGREKHRQFDKLEQAVPAAEQPAQLLKSLTKVTIFNDYKGETP